MSRKIQVQIVGDASSLEKAFRKAGIASDAFGGKMGSSAGFAAKKVAYLSGALGGLAIVAGVKGVQAASNLGEQVNKTSVVFGKSAPMIQKWAKSTADSFGIANESALEFAGTFGNMLVPMGFARDKAAKMSRSLVTLAADMASFNNASPEDVLEALRAGLSGETEPLRRFGIFLNQDRIVAEALSKGIVKTTKDLTKIKVQTVKVAKAQRDHIGIVKKYGINSLEAQESTAKFAYEQDKLTKLMKGTTPKLTAQQKAMATYSIILGDTTDAQGDFERTSNSLPNLMRRIRASVTDLAAAFGQGLLPVVVEAAGTLQKRLGDPKFREHLRTLGELIGKTLLNAFRSISDWFESHWSEIKNAFKTTKSLAEDAAEAIRKIAGALKQVSDITPGGSETMVGAIMGGALVAKIATVMAKLGLLQVALAGLSNPYVATIVITIVLGAAFYKFGPDIRKKILNRLGLNPGPGGTPAPLPIMVQPEPGGSGTNRRAVGGSVRPGQSYLVGERGPEVLTMGHSGGTINSSGGGGIYINNINLPGVSDANQLLRELQRIARSGSSSRRGRFGGSNLALG